MIRASITRGLAAGKRNVRAGVLLWVVGIVVVRALGAVVRCSELLVCRGGGSGLRGSGLVDPKLQLLHELTNLG